MSKKSRSQQRASTKPASLADVLRALESKPLSDTRRRDLGSAVKRVGRLLGEDLAQIPLDLRAIGQRLASCAPSVAGRSRKTFANVRSNFLGAARASGIRPIDQVKAPLGPEWRALLAKFRSKRVQIGLSRFARYCTARGIKPQNVNDAVIIDFINAVRDGTLHPRPNALHRQVALIWNEVAKNSRPRLRRVLVPQFRGPAKRIDWSTLPASLQAEVSKYLSWSGGADCFAADARPRALAPQTLRLRRDEIHAAVTALVDSGMVPTAITSLADLVTIENFKRILRRRVDMVGGRENMFNRDLARMLVSIARHWVKVDKAVLDQLNRLASKVPAPVSGLTAKNKAALRQFDDPENLRRLLGLPGRLWAEVKRDRKPNFRTLVKAQAALAIGILSYMPIRAQNLWSLKFDEHIFLHEGAGAISSLEFPANEVKNKIDVAFDIPSHLSKMLIEYRKRIAPKIIGKRSDRLFVKADGTAKSQWAVAWLIRTVLRQRAGLQLSAHQFRHLSAKLVLDAEPGNFEVVRQLLNHQSLRTTVASYTGISSRRAGRHHRRLIEAALAEQIPGRRRRGGEGA